MVNSTRRIFAATIGWGLLTCCSRLKTGGAEAASGPGLQSRPGKTASGAEPGVHPLGLRRERDPLLYVPKSAAADQPAPLMVFLHGAGGSEQGGLRRLSEFAEASGFLVLSPASQDSTWDAIQDSYGPDVRLIDQALARVFARCRVDERRIGLSGFSDGASYALGLGLANGDLFGSVLAFSPGFIPPGGRRTGKPRIFISHGTGDTILPIASSSRRLVPELKRSGYDVTYREFDGPHTVPREITEEAVRWFLG